jgi:hypothetical protein
MSDVTDKVDRAIAKFERVTNQLDQRKNAPREAAQRERKRLNAGLGRTALTVAIAVAVIWLGAAFVGFITPIGMFGFLAVLLATAVVATVLMLRGGRSVRSAPPPSADLPNARMVERFDTYLYRTRRALPAPAQVEIDRITALLPPLTQTLDRVETLDPKAQDARRLMSLHLPGLVDRYLNVPPAFRSERDGEGKTVDERLVEGLAAGRDALSGVCERLARDDVAALETQGRFIKSRYGEQPIDG